MAEPVALAALALDAALGWPAWLHARIGHPVGAFARVIALCDKQWNLGDVSRARRKAGGVVTLIVLVSITGLVAAGLTVLAHQSGSAGWLIVAILAWPALAQRSLDDHIVPVVDALADDDLEVARLAVAMIVGRDTATLDRNGVSRAAIESLAESFCDGVIAPLFWLLVAGLPGIWILKAINTADSLIGHLEEPYRDFGWASARTDDALNLVPARIAALLICLAGCGGWRTLWRYRTCHASPNAGWPEAAMAGALGVRLAGPISYDGKIADKPWIGHGGEAGLEALVRARRIYHRACALTWIIVLGWVCAGGVT